jgi:quercetin dioxygenase-like cupin family protein
MLQVRPARFSGKFVQDLLLCSNSNQVSNREGILVMKTHFVAVSILLIYVCGPLQSALADDHADTTKNVVPSSEYKIAQELGAEGPTETFGIESAEVLGTMSLAGEFAGTEGHMLRVREVTVLPGGQVAVHQHNSRPGAAYVLEGELIEHRNDADAPLTRVTGAVALEKTGTIHWWKNESSTRARVLVVDIVPVETE